MSWLVLFMESLSSVFFLIAFGVTSYIFMKDIRNMTALGLSFAFLLLFFSAIGTLFFDYGFASETVKILASVFNILAGVIFIYIFLSEEIAYRTILAIRRGW